MALLNSSTWNSSNITVDNNLYVQLED